MQLGSSLGDKELGWNGSSRRASSRTRPGTASRVRGTNTTNASLGDVMGGLLRYTASPAIQDRMIATSDSRVIRPTVGSVSSSMEPYQVHGRNSQTQSVGRITVVSTDSSGANRAGAEFMRKLKYWTQNSDEIHKRQGTRAEFIAFDGTSEDYLALRDGACPSSSDDQSGLEPDDSHFFIADTPSMCERLASEQTPRGDSRQQGYQEDPNGLTFKTDSMSSDEEGTFNEAVFEQHFSAMQPANFNPYAQSMVLEDKQKAFWLDQDTRGHPAQIQRPPKASARVSQTLAPKVAKRTSQINAPKVVSGRISTTFGPRDQLGIYGRPNVGQYTFTSIQHQSIPSEVIPREVYPGDVQYIPQAKAHKVEERVAVKKLDGNENPPPISIRYLPTNTQPSRRPNTQALLYNTQQPFVADIKGGEMQASGQYTPYGIEVNRQIPATLLSRQHEALFRPIDPPERNASPVRIAYVPTAASNQLVEQYQQRQDIVANEDSSLRYSVEQPQNDRPIRTHYRPPSSAFAYADEEPRQVVYRSNLNTPQPRYKEQAEQKVPPSQYQPMSKESYVTSRGARPLTAPRRRTPSRERKNRSSRSQANIAGHPDDLPYQAACDNEATTRLVPKDQCMEGQLPDQVEYFPRELLTNHRRADSPWIGGDSDMQGKTYPNEKQAGASLLMPPSPDPMPKKTDRISATALQDMRMPDNNGRLCVRSETRNPEVTPSTRSAFSLVSQGMSVSRRTSFLYDNVSTEGVQFSQVCHNVTEDGLPPRGVYMSGEKVEIRTDVAVMFPEKQEPYVYQNAQHLQKAIYQNVCACLNHEKGCGIVLFGVSQIYHMVEGVPISVGRSTKEFRIAVDNVFKDMIKPPIFPNQYTLRILPVVRQADVFGPPLSLVEIVIRKGRSEQLLRIYGSDDTLSLCAGGGTLKNMTLTQVPAYCHDKLHEMFQKKLDELQDALFAVQRKVQTQQTLIENLTTQFEQLEHDQSQQIVENKMRVENLKIQKEDVDGELDKASKANDELADKLNHMRDDAYFNARKFDLEADHQDFMTWLKSVNIKIACIVNDNRRTKEDRLEKLWRVVNLQLGGTKTNIVEALKTNGIVLAKEDN